jgi:hypothetical protein
MSNGASSKKATALSTPGRWLWGYVGPCGHRSLTKLVVALEVGERTQEQTMALVKDAQSRLAPGCLPAIFTDAYEAYPQAILEVFGHRYPVRLRCPQGLIYAQVKKHYQGKRVAWVEIRPIFGKGKLAASLKKLGYQKANSSGVERHHGTSRQRERRKVRKTLRRSGMTDGPVGFLLRCIISAGVMVV